MKGHACMCIVYVMYGTYVFGVEVEVRGFLLLFPLDFETGSLMELELTVLARLTSQQVSEIHLSHPVLWLQTHNITPSFYRDVGI